jgi:hypothetical protein
MDTLARSSGLLILGGLLYVIVLACNGLSPATTHVGYKPDQPVEFSHRLHAGELGMDCRYCHNTVERTTSAAIPPTQTCMNCHHTIKTESQKLLPVRESYAGGMPIRWTRVHDLPDFVYFDHAAHLRAGVGCKTCHGRIDTLEVVEQIKPLSMGWCIRCHREPEMDIRPDGIEVTDMAWEPGPAHFTTAREKMEREGIKPSTDCWTCHR